MVFPVVMYGCESWTIKKAEHRRTDAFELWCWRRLFRVPRTAKITTQSILKEISPEYSLERLMRSWSSNTLATWCKELTPWKRPWCWERLKAGGEGVNRRWDGWMASLTRWTWVCASFVSWWWTRKPGELRFMGSQRVGHDWATELNWTEPLLNTEAGGTRSLLSHPRSGLIASTWTCKPSIWPTAHLLMKNNQSIWLCQRPLPPSTCFSRPGPFPPTNLAALLNSKVPAPPGS